MGGDAMYRLLQAPPVRGVELAVLNALAFRADDALQCYPSLPDLVLRSGWCRRQVIAALRRLEAAGHIVIRRRQGQGNLYQCVWRTSAGDAPVRETHGTSAGDAPLPVRETHPNKSLNKSRTSHGSRKRSLPSDFALTAERAAQASTAGLSDPTPIFEQFRAYHLAKGSTFANWEQAWRTWYLKAVQFAAERSKRPGVNGTAHPDKWNPAAWGLTQAEFDAKRKKGWIPTYETVHGRS